MEILQKIDEHGEKWSGWPIEGDGDAMMRHRFFITAATFNLYSVVFSLIQFACWILRLSNILPRVRLAVRGSRGPRSIDTVALNGNRDAD